MVITRGGSITQVLAIQGYIDSMAFTILEESRIIKIYDDTNYPIHQVSSIIESNGTARVKILMKNANDAYRGYVIPLGNAASKGIKYTTNWGTS